MKLVYDGRFADSSYCDDNAALPGRMEAATSGMREGGWEIVAPPSATARQLLLARDAPYVEKVAENGKLFAMASLAAGGAILAARIAFGGEPAFACIRPPGHHASRSAAWGHCVFNNIAIALLALRAEGPIRSAFVLDIDQHAGDGTRDVLRSWGEATVFNPFAEGEAEYLDIVEGRLSAVEDADIFAVSAGSFGRHPGDSAEGAVSPRSKAAIT
jgi:acetoin utilization deacetylase AcuC-like enzyme